MADKYGYTGDVNSILSKVRKAVRKVKAAHKY